MFAEKIHLYVAIFAGIVMTAVNIWLGASLSETCTRLVMTLAVFYVVGYVAEGYIRNKIIKRPEVPDEKHLAEEAEAAEAEDPDTPTLTYDSFLPPPDEIDQI